jgi:hypothetical protein
MFALLGIEDNRVHARALQRVDHLFPPRLGQVVGEKTPVPDNHTHG